MFDWEYRTSYELAIPVALSSPGAVQTTVIEFAVTCADAEDRPRAVKSTAIRISNLTITGITGTVFVILAVEAQEPEKHFLIFIIYPSAIKSANRNFVPDSPQQLLITTRASFLSMT
jgi:hypothetical protein